MKIVCEREEWMELALDRVRLSAIGGMWYERV
jgi:hypothetical protein